MEPAAIILVDGNLISADVDGDPDSVSVQTFHKMAEFSGIGRNASVLGVQTPGFMQHGHVRFRRNDRIRFPYRSDTG